MLAYPEKNHMAAATPECIYDAPTGLALCVSLLTSQFPPQYPWQSHCLLLCKTNTFANSNVFKDNPGVEPSVKTVESADNCRDNSRHIGGWISKTIGASTQPITKGPCGQTLDIGCPNFYSHATVPPEKQTRC